MEKNIQINLFVKQMNESDALAHQGSYLASQADYNFQILDVVNRFQSGVKDGSAALTFEQGLRGSKSQFKSNEW